MRASTLKKAPGQEPKAYSPGDKLFVTKSYVIGEEGGRAAKHEIEVVKVYPYFLRCLTPGGYIECVNGRFKTKDNTQQGRNTMREYKNKTERPFDLPYYIRRRVIAVVKDGERRKAERERILHASPPPSDGLPKARTPGDPTARAALRLAEINREFDAIQRAFMNLPPEYRVGVLENVKYGLYFPIDAGEATYQRYRKRFLYYIAQELNLI